MMVLDTTVRDVFVSSKDGTVIHSRQNGQGPGLVLLHGSMQTAESFSQLARHLGAHFTVSSVDRRGRRPSGHAGAAYSVQKEVDDLAAVLAQTGAAHVFGLSSGALIALRAARELPAIARIALYEPPLVTAGGPGSPLAFVQDYEDALAAGNLAGALVAMLKGTDDPSLMTRLPRFVLKPLFRAMVAIDGWRNRQPNERPSIAELIPTAHHDLLVVGEMAGTLEHYRDLQTEVLLLGGDMSKPFLPMALDALEKALPRAGRIRLQRVGHLAAADDGAPERVAAALIPFFSTDRDRGGLGRPC